MQIIRTWLSLGFFACSVWVLAPLSVTFASVFFNLLRFIGGVENASVSVGRSMNGFFCCSTLARLSLELSFDCFRYFGRMNAIGLTAFLRLKHLRLIKPMVLLKVDLLNPLRHCQRTIAVYGMPYQHQHSELREGEHRAQQKETVLEGINAIDYQTMWTMNGRSMKF